MVTYLAGSHICIQAVLSSRELEALPIDLDLGTTWDKDTVNPPAESRDTNH